MDFRREKSFFKRFSEKVTDIVNERVEIDEELFEELEELLITSDLGMDTTIDIMERLREILKEEYIVKEDNIRKELFKLMYDIANMGEKHLMTDKRPLIILVIGVNGSGKTTTIGKLAHKYKKEGNRVLLAAADTFRAAAISQLQMWGDRVGVDVISHHEGADSAAVIYDSISAAKSRDIDVLICDTAGRLQNKKNLMEELAKLHRIINEKYPEADRENLLVIDGNTGKNGISQVENFKESADLTGIVLTKIDGTAKGGIVLTIQDQYQVPVKFIGTGEKIEDLEVFDPDEFLGGVLGE